ncbi:plasmid segregation protein ParM, partial [Xenorhabdus bovienii]|nr:plasmid segregation protein ParM [Xenorhabdus bovienii]
NYTQFNRIFLTGGGAEFIFTDISKKWSVLGNKVQKLKNPQTALVEAIAQLSAA